MYTQTWYPELCGSLQRWYTHNKNMGILYRTCIRRRDTLSYVDHFKDDIPTTKTWAYFIGHVYADVIPWVMWINESLQRWYTHNKNTCLLYRTCIRRRDTLSYMDKWITSKMMYPQQKNTCLLYRTCIRRRDTLSDMDKWNTLKRIQPRQKHMHTLEDMHMQTW